MSLFKCNIKKTAGFTLMELMIVIAIIGIVSAITIPNISNSKHRVKKVARELMGSMQKTRMLAVKTNSECAIVFDANLADGTPNPRYLICTDQGADGNWATIADNTITATVAFTHHGAGVQYNDGSGGNAGPITYGSGVLTFNSHGTCNSGDIYISYNNNSYKIGTLSTGIILIQRWNGSSYS